MTDDPYDGAALYYLVSPRDTGFADHAAVCDSCVEPFRDDARFDVEPQQSRLFPSVTCDAQVGCGEVLDNPAVEEAPDVRDLPPLSISKRTRDGPGGLERPSGSGQPSAAWDDYGGVPATIRQTTR